MARLSNTWLALACLLACVVAIWSTRKNYCTLVCTLLLCAGPIEGCSAVFAVRRYYGFRSLVCASWCSEKEKQVQKQNLLVFLGLLAELNRWYSYCSIVSKKSTSPAVMFTSRLVLPSAMTWTKKSACVANLPHLHKHIRARFLLLAVVMVLLLYCGWFWCCYYS